MLVHLAEDGRIIARPNVMGGTNAQRPVRQESLSGHPANRTTTLRAQYPALPIAPRSKRLKGWGEGFLNSNLSLLS